MEISTNSIEMDQKDVEQVVAALPPGLTTILKRTGVVVAGGFIRDTLIGIEPSDVDVFASEGNLQAVLQMKVPVWIQKNKLVWETQLEPRVIQLIMVGQNLQLQHLTRFDYTCCSVAIWWQRNQWVGTAHSQFYETLRERRLVPLCSANLRPGSSMKRLCKLVAKGWIANSDTWAMVVAATLMGTPLPGAWLMTERQLLEKLKALWREPVPEPTGTRNIQPGLPLESNQVDTGREYLEMLERDRREPVMTVMETEPSMENLRTSPELFRFYDFAGASGANPTPAPSRTATEQIEFYRNLRNSAYSGNNLSADWQNSLRLRTEEPHNG